MPAHGKQPGYFAQKKAGSAFPFREYAAGFSAGLRARPEGFGSGRAGAQRSTERWARIFSASALKAS